MEHPSPETWMGWLYGEAQPGERRALDEHLEACPECRRRVAAWREAREALDADQAAICRPAPRGASWWRAAAPWAAAAALAAGAFLAGRAGAVTPGEMDRRLAAQKQAMEADWERRHEADLQAYLDAATKISERQSEALGAAVMNAVRNAEARDRRTTLAALQSIEDRRAEQYAAMNTAFRDLARRTGAGLQEARTDLNLLASWMPPAETAERREAQPKNHQDE